VIWRRIPRFGSRRRFSMLQQCRPKQPIVEECAASIRYDGTPLDRPRNCVAVQSLLATPILSVKRALVKAGLPTGTLSGVVVRFFGFARAWPRRRYHHPSARRRPGRPRAKGRLPSRRTACTTVDALFLLHVILATLTEGRDRRHSDLVARRQVRRLVA